MNAFFRGIFGEAGDNGSFLDSIPAIDEAIANLWGGDFDNRSRRNRTNSGSRRSQPSTTFSEPSSAAGVAFAGTPPPIARIRASPTAIRQLPIVTVCPQDLIEAVNRECSICLESNALQTRVLRLPCAHIFHPQCILPWLEDSAHSCPVCRYELPTDDPEFERGRLQRMKSRKPRFARHELDRLTVKQLLFLLKQKIKHKSYIAADKADLISYLIESNIIELIPAPEPVQYSLSQLKKMSISTLVSSMNDAGVFFEPRDVVEKPDLIRVFLMSGRLDVLPESDMDDVYTVDAVKNEFDKLNLSEFSADGCMGMGSHFDGKLENSVSMKGVKVETVVEEGDEDDRSFERPVMQFHDSNGNDPFFLMEEISIYPPLSPGEQQFSNLSPSLSSISNIKNDEFDTSEKKRGSSNTVMDQPIVAAASSLPASDLEFVESSVNSFCTDQMEEHKCCNNVAMTTANENYNVAKKSDTHAEAAKHDYYKIAEKSVADQQHSGMLTNKILEHNLTPKHQSQISDSSDFRCLESRNQLCLDSSQRYNHLHLDNFDTLDNQQTLDSCDLDFTENSLHVQNIEKNRSFDFHDDNDDLRERFQHFSVLHLQYLARELSVDISSCIERKDIVDRLIRHLEKLGSASLFSEFFFNDWGVSDLTVLASLANIDLSRCSTREDMVITLRQSASIAGSSNRNCRHFCQSVTGSYLLAIAPLIRLSISQLRAVARDWRVDVSDCIEKGDIILRLVQASKMSLP